MLKGYVEQYFAFLPKLFYRICVCSPHGKVHMDKFHSLELLLPETFALVEHSLLLNETISGGNEWSKNS